MLGDVCQVSAFWDIAAHQANGVFNGSLLPAMIWLAEVGRCAELVINVFMSNILRTIVVGEGESGLLRQCTQSSGNSPNHLPGSLARHLSESDQPAFTFAGNAHRRQTLAGDESVGFPMAELLAFADMSWPLIDGRSVGDIRVFSAFSLTF